ncbi:MAG: MOSC domain-containing protein [Telmatospirillum sp.]|nr:MOSC domain-containing protein [Telmatospirillum sp.]
MRFPISHLLVGGARLLGDTGALSAIDKKPVDGPLFLGREGFVSDAQADRRHHGGPDKAVHHYSSAHYAVWRREIGDRPVLDAPGAFGENLSAPDLDESRVAVGDRFRLGHALIEVSQGRQPCWKLNHRFGQPDMARLVQKTGRTGWYYRVLEEGRVEPGDDLILVDRPSPDWTIRRLWHLFYVTPLDRGELSAMLTLTHLPESWRALARRRLETLAVEDWSPRLDGR